MQAAIKEAQEKAKQLGGEVQPWGIGWGWIHGFTKENAEEFVRWLDANDFDHRGIYPPDHISDSYAVRYR